MAFNPNERFEIEPPRTSSQVNRSTGRRGCWWILLPVGCLTALAVCGGIVGAILFGAMSAMKSTQPYQTAVTLAQQDATVREALGDNITPGWSIQGSFHIENDTGEVQMTIPLSGSKSSGQVRVEGRLENGVWDYDKLLFTDSLGQQVDLLPAQQSGEVNEVPSNY
jgi:hypothetical protein